MFLSKITINNFRLIVNAELDVHRNITLIVGRNNTAKTSCMSILEKVVKNKVLSYNDYPLQRRKYAFILLAQFMRKKITYEQLCKRLPLSTKPRASRAKSRTASSVIPFAIFINLPQII